MDVYNLFLNMMLQGSSSLPNFVTSLQSEGRITFTRAEAIAALGVTEGAFLKAAARLQKRHMLFNPRHGFYVAVPPQFMNWEAPPPPWYIDALMRHEQRSYYVGLLKAAELHGATHHAVMEFQVVTDKQLRMIRAGRSWVAFYFRKDLESVREGVVDRKTDTGSMKISGPELTALDLFRYMHAAGGIDAVATVMTDLAESIDGQKLAAMSAHFERACGQRLGYLLDRLGHAERANPLHDRLLEEGAMPWVTLEPERRKDGTARRTPVERNERWRVIVRRYLDIDE
ncbi:putative transcriptional regulator of viral defense system [Bradyrhizobium sp. USDA 4524]|uniref:type IV toxin-antitoxin system AbiEi family antitoxin domain-containing protein n=1 Tax=unclassified Bradyrhizobium TaxID=2631580 RepID=UPI00209D1793|nr:MULTISPECIES: type IV toxin-antitoxin system AbiEi family antitoxin [unclassified Bradyrhizobium]MCP1845826.1 putative transcriptional regulator of viral defense system [Bradyrhizobium sp. USDA 4538]MCP1906851.1 putative transcriptional regulator of viral defense system [Bradyrhizobium sp. USDA 4537]MCP1985326.1 putative transcriptional regulator of viral defense system [Bradyrhizobium sp. USDA 4539]